MTGRKSFDSNGVQFAWDATSLECAQTCLRKYYYNILEGWQPKRTSVHLIFGALYATALEHYYLHVAKGMTPDEALREIVREALTNSYGKEFDHSAKTRVNLIRSIIWYVEEFGDESDTAIKTLIKSNGEPAVEESFALEVADDLVLCGHLDRVVYLGEPDGPKFWMDQKTSGSTIGPYYFEQFNPHNQFSLYTFAGQMIFNEPIRGGFIDAAQIAVGFTRFERAQTTRTQDQLDEWYENSLYTIDLAKSATMLNKFPMNLSACGNYGGCPYRSVCSRSPSVRDNYLRADFVKQDGWDPIKAR